MRWSLLVAFERALSEAARRDVAVERSRPFPCRPRRRRWLVRSSRRPLQRRRRGRRHCCSRPAGCGVRGAGGAGAQGRGAVAHLGDRAVHHRGLPVGVAGDATDAQNESAGTRAFACALSEPSPVALEREHAKLPYSQAQIDGYLR